MESAVFVCFSAGSGRVTWYRADLTSVKFTLESSEVALARFALVKL